MFRNAKVGDRVWDFIEQWGTIVEIDEKSDFPLVVEFDNNEEEGAYTYEGKEFEVDFNPRLFWDEIKYEIPKKPFSLEAELRKLEKTDFEFGNNNYGLIWNNQFRIIDLDYCTNYQVPCAVYFTKNSIKDFMENTKNKEITKEEFFKAYKKVFGGID